MSFLITPPSGTRLRFERASIDDALQLVQPPERMQDSDVSGYPDHGTRFFALRMLERNPDLDDEFVMYHVVERATGTRVGHVGFHGRPDERGRVRIGYAIALGARGRGYATEAVGWIVAWSDRHGDVTVLEADTDEGNLASQRVLEVNGFQLAKVTGSTWFYHRPVTSTLKHRA